MPEAVIVDAIRTPIGRAAKGSLKDVRTDDLAAVPLRALVERNPGVDFGETNDLMMGCGFQLGEAGYNVGRNAALLAGLDHHVPATTVNRFCASSLQTIRMAFHAIKAGEGDQYVAAGVEAVSRFPPVAPYDPHPQLDGSDGAPFNVYIPMGLTAENVAERCKVSRAAQDEWAALSQNRAVEARDSGHFDAEIVPVTLADGTEVARDDGPRPGTTVEVLAELIDASSVGGASFELGAATFDMTRIVTGQLDAYVEPGPRLVTDVPGMRAQFELVGGGAVLNNSPYDLAAAVLVVEEAGGVVTDAYGRSLADRPLLGSDAEFQMSVVAASNPVLHERVLASVHDGVKRVSG
jgi:acetyl-CoA acetyltransferase